MPNLLNSTVLNYFFHIGQIYYKLEQKFQSGGSVLQSGSGITKLGKVT